MTAKKCDVCETLYEQRCMPDIQIAVYIHPQGEERVDLCPKCQEKLEKLIAPCWQYKAVKVKEQAWKEILK